MPDPIRANAQRIWDEAAANVAAGITTETSGSRHADEDTTIRLSRHARRQQRRPVPVRISEDGYDDAGIWHPYHDDERNAR